MQTDVLIVGGGLSGLALADHLTRHGRDFILVKPIAAIEVKSHRQKRHQRYLLETLGMATLAAREYSKTILVIPESWGDSSDVMAKLIEELNIGDVKLATFKEGDGVRSPGEFKYVVGS